MRNLWLVIVAAAMLIMALGFLFNFSKDREREFIERCTVDGYTAFECEQTFNGQPLPCKCPCAKGNENAVQDSRR